MNKARGFLQNRKLLKAESELLPSMDYQGQAASDLIRDKLLSREPCMISRFGHTEMKAVLRYWNRRRHGMIGGAARFVRGIDGPWWWDDDIRWEMQYSSGFFPCTDDALNKFSARYLDDAAQVDILGSWLPGESLLATQFSGAKRVPVADLFPTSNGDPWSAALEGKKVLVIHPFETSIRRQYEKRSLLFADKRILPDFELKTFKAVQSLGGNAAFKTWFDALEWMCGKVREIEFEVALIGAGAYGLPLAAFVKGMRQKAVHLGGGLQMLFGIRGIRWDQRPEFRKLYNEFWARPLPEEKPVGLDGGGPTRQGQQADGATAYW